MGYRCDSSGRAKKERNAKATEAKVGFSPKSRWRLPNAHAWRVFWLTMVNRTSPNTTADVAFTDTEMEILNYLVGKAERPAPKKLSKYIVALAKLGGYLARKNDGPPGNNVLWRGITRLTDVSLGVEIGRKLMGN